MLSAIYAECRKQAHYAEFHYAECPYAECRSALNQGNLHKVDGSVRMNSQYKPYLPIVF
jgi:hypothetical protein